MDGRFPSQDDIDREGAIIKRLRPVIDKTPGGIFILTTSVKATHLIADKLRGQKDLKRKIICQYENLSNTMMVESFKKDGHAILVGSVSFWAGVDVPGCALSLVIIDKLPFNSPSDPIFSARIRRFERNREKNATPAFATITIPEAVITLRQGVGRLIRHEHDRGAMIICDPRLINRNYGKIFLRSLPPMRRFDDLYALCNFLGSFSEQNAH